MEIQKLLESLSPNEVKILAYLEEDINNICVKTNLDRVSVLRALEYLQNKDIVKLSSEKKKIIEIWTNGALYRKKGLPERRLLNLLSEKRIMNLDEASDQSRMSDEEFKVSIGVLKKKAMVEVKNGRIILNADKSEIAKKMPEEHLIENLPMDYDSLSPEQTYAVKSLQNRKDIIEIKEEKTISIKITELGKKIISTGIKTGEMIEEINSDILKNEKLWKGKKFRRYDVASSVPAIYGGKRHFANQAIDYGRKIWTEMGFKEMTGDIVQSSFWNFDSLFTAQDHPVREIHDTFFIDKKAELPDKKLVEAVRKAHERGVSGSKGWKYVWNEEEAKRLCLRTHTTCLSAQTLAKLKSDDIPAKFFAIGWNFRNETIDWNHGFELLQTEGIVVDKNANLRHLMGYLKEFAKKMGFPKIRFRPAYFPYTEPSMEGDVWNEEKQEWVEYIASGIFRPEVTEPLLGRPIPVLAWGPGFGRMLMQFYNLKDLREIQENNITKLRKMKWWGK